MVRGQRRVAESKTRRAGLTFPVPRTKNTLKSKMAGLCGNGLRMSWCGAVYATALAEYLTAEVLEISGNCAKSFKLRRITPRHILLATQNDTELVQVFKNVTIPSAGVVPTAVNGKNAPVKKAVKATTTGVAKGPAKAGKTLKTFRAVAQQAINKNRKATVAKGRKGKAAVRGGATTTMGTRTLSGGQCLHIVSADIVDVAVDAIVVPSSSNWNLGGQVGNRLSTVGGAVFRTNINAAAARALGANSAGIVDGDNFAAPHVIFCNGPGWRDQLDKNWRRYYLYNCADSRRHGYRTF